MNIQQRLAELAEEIRHYPTPIARCDVQLTALLEERSALVKKLEDDNGSCTPAAIWTNDGGFNAA